MFDEDLNVPPESEGFASRASARQADNFEVLMERYQQADQAAVRALIERLSPVLLRFFRYHGARPDQAEDLVQDTWLRIHRVRHSYRPGEPLLPWVFAIARRTRVDHFRRNLRVNLYEVPSSVLPEAAAPASDAGQLPTLANLTAALPAAQREVVIMLKAGGMTVEEVARATGSTAGAVKQKAHRAYRKLRELLESAPGRPVRRPGAE